MDAAYLHRPRGLRNGMRGQFAENNCYLYLRVYGDKIMVFSEKQNHHQKGYDYPKGVSV